MTGVFSKISRIPGGLSNALTSLTSAKAGEKGFARAAIKISAPICATQPPSPVARGDYPVTVQGHGGNLPSNTYMAFPTPKAGSLSGDAIKQRTSSSAQTPNPMYRVFPGPSNGPERSGMLAKLAQNRAGTLPHNPTSQRQQGQPASATSSSLSGQRPQTPVSTHQHQSQMMQELLNAQRKVEDWITANGGTPTELMLSAYIDARTQSARSTDDAKTRNQAKDFLASHNLPSTDTKVKDFLQLPWQDRNPGSGARSQPARSRTVSDASGSTGYSGSTGHSAFGAFRPKPYDYL